MDPVLEYVFGNGDSEPTHWHTPADTDTDADGVLDAIALDFDGDGRRDDLLIDTDADGIADLAALDLDDDDTVEHHYRDSGNGIWGVAVPTREAPPAPHIPGTPTPVTPTPADPAPTDTRVQAHDLDGDGTPDIEILLDAGAIRRLYVDTDSDGRADQVLVDSDGDGTADAAYAEGEPGFGR
ncbi:hypothetical protein [Gordonia polyisoprenivorans]|uniref:hypothetical protein n=1 Tax=Gordonia polyisoprenivorans TaxID=84595 RepID=UPI000B99EB9D|nr:hypothetical protein [Gordonia polyisoprenivorans]OZC34364.1 hypothetical protein CJJ17_17080 [Gordonia polyisoprenivorans]UZF56419.1 hypothetical protein LH935_27805 [Gordonia polyisoprenivorans]